jgi:metacaspase-1
MNIIMKVSMNHRKALNIGINQFEDYPEFTLRGCVNDVKNFSRVLIENLGFSEEDIVELIDEQATKANIVNTLKSIVNDARQGKYSYIVLKLSTHGTQIGDESGTEVDHMDEAFVPYDVAQIGDDWDREHIIVDDELAEILSALPSNALFEGFADTGHSSTGIRMKESLQAIAPVREVAPAIINRYVEPIRRSESRSTTVLKELDLQKHGMHYALTDYDMRNYVWWSGYRDDQTSADANIAEGRGWHGAFTYYLCDEIRKFGNRKTRSALMDSIRAALAGRYTQVPELHSRPEYYMKRFLRMH